MTHLIQIYIYVTTWYEFTYNATLLRGPDSVVGIATGYWLDGPGIESRWGQDFPNLSRPALGPTHPPGQWVPGLSRGENIGRAWRWPLTPFLCRGHERMELYLYSPYGPYGLYRASVPVQVCTLPLHFYNANMYTKVSGPNDGKNFSKLFWC